MRSLLQFAILYVLLCCGLHNVTVVLDDLRHRDVRLLV